MKYTSRVLVIALRLFLSSWFSLSLPLMAQTQTPNTKFINAHYFNGYGFDTGTIYSVNGHFSFDKPSRIDSTIDLKGLYLLPPFGEAHNHNIGTGVMEWDSKAIRNYIDAGVFYVKIQGNYPVNDSIKKALNINRPGTIDVLFAQGNITSPGGHPIPLVESLLARGFYPGNTKESLNDRRYFIINSKTDLETKWPLIIRYRPDFIKVLLSQSDRYEELKNDSTVRYRGLDPKLIPLIVKKAHAENLKVSAHIINAHDFHTALLAGVDKIAHMPRMISGIPYVSISAEDAKLAARRRVTVITTHAISLYQGGTLKREDFAQAREIQAVDLQLLYNYGVSLAIGSDDPADNSSKEVLYLKELGVFDNLTLLKIWAQNTPSAIFPTRKLGAIKQGYEASFLALEGNPAEDLNNVRRIKLRFNQGKFLQ